MSIVSDAAEGSTAKGHRASETARAAARELRGPTVDAAMPCHIGRAWLVIRGMQTKGLESSQVDRDWLAERFEEHRTHLRAVGYQMLGSLTEADDAVQESWLRLSRSDASEIENLRGWLTTVVARICLNMLQSRKVRREEALGVHVPDPIVSRDDETDPEHEALLADSVGLALMVVLDTLAPAERLAFVLHDVFAVPYDEIAPIVRRSPGAARQLASRARRRVQDAPVPEPDLERQREVVDAFLAAVREGDFEALLEVLDPDVVRRADFGPLRESREIQGARTVAEHALAFSQLAPSARLALVNGTVGLVASPGGGKVFAVLGFTIKDGRIVEIDILGDPARLARLDGTASDENGANRKSLPRTPVKGSS